MTDDQSADPHAEFRRQSNEHFSGEPSPPYPARGPHSDYLRQADDHFAAQPSPPPVQHYPHTDFLRQAADRFDAPIAVPNAPVPPRIHGRPVTEPIDSSATPAQAANTTPHNATPSAQTDRPRYSSGHVGPGRALPPSTAIEPPVRPVDAGPAPSVPATVTPSFRPGQPSSGSTNPWNPPSGGPTVGPSDQQPAVTGVNLQPHHALWTLAALSLVCVFVSTLGWLLVAAGFAVGGWYTQTRGVTWPPDVEEALVSARLTRPTVRAATPGVEDARAAFIPFRSMTLQELFGGALKIVAKNWPALVGIPAAVFLLFVAVFAVVMLLAAQTMSAALSSAFADSAGSSFSFTGFFMVFIVLTLVMGAVALPADALLIALSVIATDKAVRGEPIRLSEVSQAARGRMFAVCRLTLAFYTIFLIAPVLLLSGILVVAIGVSPVTAMPLMFGVFFLSFVLSIVLSLSPTVMVVENRGVVDSMKRSVQLTKPAWARLLGIHLLGAVCLSPLIAVPALLVGLVLGSLGVMLFYAIALGALLGYFRTLQMLIYTDLRIRQENYDRELLADWSRNTGV